VSLFSAICTFRIQFAFREFVSISRINRAPLAEKIFLKFRENCEFEGNWRMREAQNEIVGGLEISLLGAE
jgi:hypothetical protein